MESQISSREEVEEILTNLGEQLSKPVQFLVIGGAAMLEYGLKDAIKDIDLDHLPGRRHRETGVRLPNAGDHCGQGLGAGE